MLGGGDTGRAGHGGGRSACSEQEICHQPGE